MGFFFSHERIFPPRLDTNANRHFVAYVAPSYTHQKHSESMQLAEWCETKWIDAKQRYAQVVSSQTLLA